MEEEMLVADEVNAKEELAKDIDTAVEKMVSSACSLYDSWYANLELKRDSWTNINGFMKAKSAISAIIDDYDPDMAISLANCMADVYEDAATYFAVTEPDHKFEDIKRFAEHYNEYLSGLYDPEITKREFDAMRYAVELASMQLCQDVDDIFSKLKELIDYSEDEIQKSRDELEKME